MPQSITRLSRSELTMHSTSVALLESLTIITGLESSTILSLIGEKNLESAASLLQVKTPSNAKNVIRLILGPLLTVIPAELRMKITDLLKKIRNPSKELAYLDPLSGIGNRLLTDIKPDNQTIFFNTTKRFGLALSHDVDTSIGYKFVPKMAEDLKIRGLTSSFYFLTHADYVIDPLLIRELIDAGFEVGIHGKNHDIGIAMRSRKSIRSWLNASKQRIGIDKPGFRSPGLSVSNTLMQELQRAGFLYDSSLQYGCSFYHSTEYSFPFRLPGLQLWELPIWFQDAFLFRDARMEPENALSWCKEMISRMSDIGAMIVFLLHPDIMVLQKKFWQMFIDYAAEIAKKDALVQPVDQFINLFDSHYENRK